MSLAKALDILGHQTYHMTDIQESNHSSVWLEVVQKSTSAYSEQAFRESLRSWADDMLLKGFTAMTGFPIVIYYKEFMDFYPEAKVILTLRAGEKWFDSWSRSMKTEVLMQSKPFRWFHNVPFMKDTMGAANSIYSICKLSLSFSLSPSFIESLCLLMLS